MTLKRRLETLERTTPQSDSGPRVIHIASVHASEAGPVKGGVHAAIVVGHSPMIARDEDEPEEAFIERVEHIAAQTNTP